MHALDRWPPVDDTIVLSTSPSRPCSRPHAISPGVPEPGASLGTSRDVADERVCIHRWEAPATASWRRAVAPSERPQSTGQSNTAVSGPWSLVPKPRSAVQLSARSASAVPAST